MRNRYGGRCASCGDIVDAGAGEYSRGATWCDGVDIVSTDEFPAWRIAYANACGLMAQHGREFDPCAARDIAADIAARYGTDGGGRFAYACPSTVARWRAAADVDADAVAADIAARDAAAAALRVSLLARVEELAAVARVRSLPQVITKATGAAGGDLAALTVEELAAVCHDLTRRIERRERRGVPASTVCHRCGGTGVFAPFGECWGCDGTGVKARRGR